MLSPEQSPPLVKKMKPGQIDYGRSLRAEVQVERIKRHDVGQKKTDDAPGKEKKKDEVDRTKAKKVDDKGKKKKEDSKKKGEEGNQERGSKDDRKEIGKKKKDVKKDDQQKVKKKMFLSSNSSDDFIPGSLRRFGTVVTKVSKNQPKSATKKKVTPSNNCDFNFAGSSNVNVDGMPSEPTSADSASTSAASK